MDYGLPKTLPVTGAGVLAVGSVTNQLLIVSAIVLGVYVVALAIRYAWRRNKTLGE